MDDAECSQHRNVAEQDASKSLEMHARYCDEVEESTNPNERMEDLASHPHAQFAVRAAPGRLDRIAVIEGVKSLAESEDDTKILVCSTLAVASLCMALR